MKFPADARITARKLDELRERIERLGVDLSLVEEQFIRGSGPGGQKVNKTASTVQLHYPPLQLVIRCSRERSQSLNRFLALRELIDRIEMQLSPQTSARLKARDRIRSRKDRAKRRTKTRSDNGK